MLKYPLTSKLLHQLALEWPAIAELAFDIERATSLKNAPKSIDGKHIFISGLARSGTTILMRSLYQCSGLCSLTYKDMPFVLSPNIWAKITGLSHQVSVAEERAHKDGILVDFDSPEALDEVFWRVFSGEDYIGQDALKPMTAETNLIEKFRDYISLILKRYNSSRYLSKNNNNVLRIDSIRTAFPNCTIIVPFRDPIQHSFSLLTQHKLFAREQREDPFSRKYMSWLAHHEFGIDHRPFIWGKKLGNSFKKDTLDYWLAQWIGVYEFLLEQYNADDTQVIFLGYETLCEQKETVWPKLLSILDLDCTGQDNPDFQTQTREIGEVVDERLGRVAADLYKNLSLCSLI